MQVSFALEIEERLPSLRLYFSKKYHVVTKGHRAKIPFLSGSSFNSKLKAINKLQETKLNLIEEYQVRLQLLTCLHDAKTNALTCVYRLQLAVANDTQACAKCMAALCNRPCMYGCRMGNDILFCIVYKYSRDKTFMGMYVEKFCSSTLS